MQIDIYDAHRNGTENISVFCGLNRKRRGERGEAEDMDNMSSAEYPCAAPRGARETVSQTQYDIKYIAAPDSTTASQVSGLTGIMNGAFYYNGVNKSDNAILDMSFDWQIIRKGNLYIINGHAQHMSVMYYYNVDEDEFGMASVTMNNLIVKPGRENSGAHRDYMSACYINVQTFPEVAAYEYTDVNGNITSNNVYFRQYSITGSLFSDYFEIGDEVTIRGFQKVDRQYLDEHTYAGEIKYMPYWEWVNGSIRPLNYTSDITKNNTIDTDDYQNTSEISSQAIVKAVVSGFGTSPTAPFVYFDLTQTDGREGAFNYEADYWCSGITIEKKTKHFDNIAAHNGRIWGTTLTGNAIYASSSDNIFSFSPEDITNKYAARLVSDTPGKFTALCEYGSDIIAFKEDSISVVMGNNPVNYSIYTINDIGCIDGHSVAVTPYGVVFLSHNGFCCYTGSSRPTVISEKLDTRYVSAAGGYVRDKYYASAQREDGEAELLSCDMKRGLWHKEDDAAAVGFFSFLGAGYFADDRTIYKMTDRDADNVLEWSFTTVRDTAGILDNKAINGIWIRADVSEGAEFTVSTASGNSAFAEHMTFSETGLNVFRCPVRAVMGTDFRIRISGKGRVVLYELELVIAGGGRRYKER